MLIVIPAFAGMTSEQFRIKKPSLRIYLFRNLLINHRSIPQTFTYSFLYLFDCHKIIEPLFLKSVARNHYPQFVFREGSKLLWNPILKKAFVDRPEERVRLQIVDYLILEAGFSSSRISFESPVHLPRDKSASRTDVICFDKEFKPLLLIECKAPEIKLTEKASIQIARYNQKVGAPFLLITNGLEDFWFSSEQERIENLSTVPSEFDAKSTLEINFEYWSQRGFAGTKSHPNTRNWILQSCDLLYNSDEAPFPTYLKFEGSPAEFYMPNYYRIFEKRESTKLALSLTGTPFGATKLNGVLNKDGANSVILSCSLDLLATGDSKNTTLHSASGTSYLDLSTKIALSFSASLDDQINELVEFLSKY